jgi:hypothetical protein
VRPHVRVIPLVIAFVVAMGAVTLIPVQANERLCMQEPENPECKDPPTVPWIVRILERGY